MPSEYAPRIDIFINTAEYVRTGGIIERKGLTIAREELEIRYFGLTRLAQAFGPVMRARGADGVNSAAASSTCCRSMRSQLAGLRRLLGGRSGVPVGDAVTAGGAATRRGAGGKRVLRPVGDGVVPDGPPPKVAPAAWRGPCRRAQQGLEDVFVGDVAEDVRARLAVNPKAVERELAAHERTPHATSISRTCSHSPARSPPAQSRSST